ncbi:GNAT family N-acetyltransferase [Streptomyces rubiginosohelvolus]|uniref:GNAT family N-acetyltransferase n=1 Tax=Streptomyces rubiginosohelvolus TaxID=67362 RepID=UPI0036DEADAC
MPNPLLRLATPDDCQPVIELLTQVWKEERRPDRWQEDLQEQAECGDGARRGVWVLDDAGAVVSVAVVHRQSPKEIAGRTWPVYLAYLITDEQHRGRGYSALLENHVMAELARQGRPGAYLKVHKEDAEWEKALGFWKHQGWEQPAGSTNTHVLMTKETALPSAPGLL